MAISPMMKHYLDIKQKYKDAVVFYRLGDFYEMFFEDAVNMSKALELTLTGKDCGLEERAPMCGVPAKAVDTYIAKALNLNYKVAICEQLTEPTNNGEIVERDVVRVVTPGTVMEDSILEEKKNNYILSVFLLSGGIGTSWCDISTGECNAMEFAPTDFAGLNDLLIMVNPSEIICNQNAKQLEEKLLAVTQHNVPDFSIFNDWFFEPKRAEDTILKQLQLSTLKSHDLFSQTFAIGACGGLLSYLAETQKRSLSHINKILRMNFGSFMHLDYQTRKNLELTQNFRDGGKKGTILWLLDKTATSMGARYLRKCIEQPLQKPEEIAIRQNGVNELYQNLILKDALTEQLSKIADIERLSGKISYGTVTPRDCLALKTSFERIPALKNLLKDSKSLALISVRENLDDLADMAALISNAIDENAPALSKDGGIIKKGYNAELDELKLAAVEGKTWLNNLEAKEQQETKIKGLKIGYNRIFGYFLEVTNSQKELVPFRYARKQTLSNCERYVTAELKEIEDKILGSEEKSIKLEQELFNQLQEILKQHIERMQQSSRYLAYLDFLLSLAIVTGKNNYVMPHMVGADQDLIIEDGRHPIVESINREPFVPNDTHLNRTDNKTMIITGPNMAGKSTYMRQVAVIVLLAHIGSFVPAKSAQIPVIDRIFTRIGATDDLAYGQSTFMVEMSEVANILNNATENSLILLDEVGRGTSTFDGLSIAWSVMEYVSKNLTCKTLFSTHYHELTELEGVLDGIKNYSISVKEFNGSVIFLRKIVRGGANKSFGIEVASLAGLPKQVILRAKEILKQLEQSDISHQAVQEVPATGTLKPNQAEILNILSELDIERISPLEAFGVLNDLKNKAKR